MAAEQMSRASSLRDKIRSADRIYAALAQCEATVEAFVVTQIGGAGAAKSHALPAAPQPKLAFAGEPARFADMSLAEIGRTLLADGGTLHGSKIEELAIAGGCKTRSKNFQDMLRVAFRRDGGFENVGRNQWRLKQEGAAVAAIR